MIQYFAASIRNKIITPYALLTLLLAASGVFIISRFVILSFEARLTRQIQETGQIVSDETVNHEQIRLEIERVVANTIGVGEAVVNQDIRLLNELVFPIIANAKIVDSIIIIDLNRKEVLRLQRDNIGSNAQIQTSINSQLDLSQWSAVNIILDNVDSTKEVQLARDDDLNELIIYTVGPIIHDNKVVGAALVGTYLQKEIGVLRSLAGAHLILFDETGQVLATSFTLSQQEQAEIYPIFTSVLYKRVLDSGNIIYLDEIDVAESEFDNNTGQIVISQQTYRLAYAPFILRSRAVGVYAVALSTNHIAEASIQSQLWIIALFSLGLVTVLGVGWFISRQITKPISSLVSTAQAISGGDLNRRTGINQSDEIGYLASNFDSMTGRLQYLLQIQMEEASKLNAILNSIVDGVAVQDLDGHLLVINPAGQQLLDGIETGLENSPSKSLQIEGVEVSVVGNNDVSSLVNQLTGLQFRKARRFEVGRKVFDAQSAPVLRPDKTELGSVVVLRDVTREVESEKLKDEFITSASHELKTPLTAIKGYIGLLSMMTQMNPDAPMADRQKSILETLNKEANDLDDIIQSMLDLSQIDAATLGIDQAPVNLSELILDKGEEWTVKMEDRELSFKVQLPNDPVWVKGDRNRLARVLHNLIKNAHDYTLPAGQIEVQVTQTNGQSRIDIKDTGVGIRESDQRFLFTKFFRAVHEESHFGAVSGVGLGLYTSRAIIEAHDGELWMKQSDLNQGSVFSFILPVINPDEIDDDDDDF